MGMHHLKLGMIGYMEWLEFMGNTESRRRELANIEVGAKPEKKSGSASSKQASRKASAASNAKKSASGTKNRNSASKQGMKTQNTPKKKKPSVEENPIAHRTSHAYQNAPAPSMRRSETYDYDPYDMPAPRRPAPPRKRKRKKKKKAAFSFVSFLLLLMIVGFGGLCAWRVQEYEAFSEMKAAVSSQTFYRGTTVEGIDVSNMTLQQAVEYWDAQIEPAYRETAVVLNDGTRITAGQMGYASNYREALSGAWSAGRSGSLVERYKRMQLRISQPTAYSVERSFYDEALVLEYVQHIAAQVDRDPVDAKVKSFDINTYAFEFEADQTGYRLNQQALAGDIAAALGSGGGSVQLQVEAIAPAVTQENVAAQYGMISYAVTNASSSSSNRMSNIKLALESINGTWLDPGESFSFNETVGKRTAERGYKSATAYSGGKVTEELGGGICQVSTTLFNAAVKADLKIDRRSSHSLTVSYVDIGKDAAVDWDNKDLCFTNISEDRVYICGYVNEEKRVCIGIFGKLLPDGMTITVESEKTGTRKYETEYQMSFELAPGQTRVLQKGKDGSTAVAYKVWHDADGNEIRRSELCKSSYQSTPEIIEYGP